MTAPPDDVITALVEEVGLPLGTPVTIHAWTMGCTWLYQDGTGVLLFPGVVRR